MPILSLVIFVNVLGYGLIVPLLPFYVERLGGGPELITLIIAMYALVQFAASPWLGRLSDRFGRRPVLAWTTAGTACAHALLAAADSLALIILSRALAGAMAGNIGVAFAYTADVTPKADRSEAFGRLTAGFTLGLTFGPGLGGLLAGTDVETANFVVPATSAAAMSLLACLCVFLFVKETRPGRQTAPPALGAPKPSLAAQLGLVLREATLGRLGLATFLSFVAWSAMLSIFALWSNRVLAQGPLQIGLLFMWMGLVGAAAQLVVIGPVGRKIGDLRVLRLSVVGMLAGMIALTLADSVAPAVVALAVISAANSVFIPVSNSLVSKVSALDDRGAVLGIFQSIGSLGRVAGPTFSGAAFANLGYDSPLHIGALVLVPCLVLLIIGVEPSVSRASAADRQRDEASR